MSSETFDLFDKYFTFALKIGVGAWGTIKTIEALYQALRKIHAAAQHYIHARAERRRLAQHHIQDPQAIGEAEEALRQANMEMGRAGRAAEQAGVPSSLVDLAAGQAQRLGHPDDADALRRIASQMRASTPTPGGR